MSAAEVIKLVDQLYGQSGDKSSKSVADKKLQSFQSTSSAWPVSLELLTRLTLLKCIILQQIR